MMAKRSQKRSPRREKDRVGCMWGLISLFDFRNGHSTQRLISDRRRGSNRHASGTGNTKRSVGLLINGDKKCEDPNTSTSNLSDGDEIQMARVESIRISVKALLDEEMSKVPHSKKQSPIAAGDRSGRNHKQINKTCKVACDHQSQKVRACESFESRSSRERFPEMEEFCCQNHQHLEMHLNHMNGTDSCHIQKILSCVESNEANKPEMRLVTKQAILEEKEGEAIEAFLIQKFIDTEQLFREESLIQSKEFMEALEILNLNKDLFLKLIQDPNSVLVKQIQELRNAQAGIKLSVEENRDSVQCGEINGHKQSRKQNIQSFFRRKDKEKCKKESEASKDSNRIVVLKPGYASIQNSTSATSPCSSPQSQFRLRNHGESETVPSHFSLREIKRKWKHVIGESKKEQHRISMDGILHKIPYGHQDQGDIGKELESKDSCHNERTSKPSASKKKDKIGKQKACEMSTKHEVAFPSLDSHINTTNVLNSHQRGANIYEEAKKHLAEMLNIGDGDGESQTEQIPKTLGRILSLPEYMSPRTSPGNDVEPSFQPEQIGYSPNSNFQNGSENAQMYGEESAADNLNHLSNAENSTLFDHKQADGEVKLLNSSSELLEGLPFDTKKEDSISIRGDLTEKGSIEIEETTDVECIEESDLIDIPSELENDRPIADNHQCTDEVQNYAEEGSSECLKLDSFEENRQLGSPSTSSPGSPLHIRKIEDPDSICEKTERPSPVSVLEPLYVEDVIDHKSPEAHLDDLPMQPRKIHFEEHIDSNLSVTTLDPEIYPRTCRWEKESELDYVKSVLEASGLCCEDFIERCHSSNQPLNPSLFEEVEASFTQSSDNRKLIFDCTNEVLMEVFERFFRCSPWVSFVKPNIRPMPPVKYVVQEVWKGIDWHILRKVPCKLDQIVGKDMAKSGRWMDLRFYVESVGIEMGDDILEELLEETIQELLN